MRQTAGFGSNAFEDVVNERVHDAHCLGADASIGMDLLQDLVDVDAERLLATTVALLPAHRFCDFSSFLLAFLRRYLRRHSK